MRPHSISARYASPPAGPLARPRYIADVNRRCRWFRGLFAMLFLGVASVAQATHNRAGEIIYEHVEGLTYKITIITCTKASALADRPYLKIRWGDEPAGIGENELDSLERGVEQILPGMDAKRNEYVGFHTYGGPGIFEIVAEDPNRNAGVVNIVNSVWQIFCIRSVLVISPFTAHNNSVQLLNPPKEQACIFQPWIHNPAAFDPDGDELRYSLIPCMGAGCEPLPGWEMPDDATDNSNSDTFTIDPVTGDITWLVPPLPGEFNIAILIEEYRDGVFVGSVVRDMQINVIICSNQPPVIEPLPDYCVEAGESLTIDVEWSDPNNHTVTAIAYGGPMTEVQHQATFNTMTGVFNWNPECEEIRAQPYSVTFKATDNGTVNLTDLETIQITVVAPRVENPEALALGNSITLTWEANACAETLPAGQHDEVVYKIYRRLNLFGFEPDACELGVPEYTGYTFLAQVTGLDNTTYTDSQVTFGGTYCYMVATCFPDGAISYASEEFCAQIRKDMPVITKVSIGATDATAGVDTLWWSPPTELDTLVFTGPYRYRVLHRQGPGQPDNLVYESSESPFLIWGDTTFIHTGLNTRDLLQAYQVQFFSGGELVTSSSVATSHFLELTPLDNAMSVSFSFTIPWNNVEYAIYRLDPGAGSYELAGITSGFPWVDDSLENNRLYCYYAIVQGSYPSPLVPDPLINYSQIACAQPFDQTPPCAPQLSVSSSCAEGENVLAWTNPNSSCADDVTAYRIYHAPVEGDELTLIATIDLAEDTTYLFTAELPNGSIAGCFAVTALDSLNLWPDGNFYQNESERSNVVCVDNCPLYFLPNIFTPNSDGLNDLFVPFEYRYVQDIDLRIFNRWGIEVFRTADPDIRWNGVQPDSGNLCSDGTYYYTITVNTIRLSGIVPERFSGSVQIHNGTFPTNTSP